MTAWRSWGDGLACAMTLVSTAEVASSKATEISKFVVLAAVAVDEAETDAADVRGSNALGRMMGNNGVSMTYVSIIEKSMMALDDADEDNVVEMGGDNEEEVVPLLLFLSTALLLTTAPATLVPPREDSASAEAVADDAESYAALMILCWLFLR